ncbi:hypothetical protein GCM10010518_00590 [Kitasatospora cinereorecta]
MRIPWGGATIICKGPARAATFARPPVTPGGLPARSEFVGAGLVLPAALSRGTAVLMAHPATLRNLVKRYEALRSLHVRLGTPESVRHLEDVSYTLCVTTGTRTVPDALSAAEAQLRAVPSAGSVMSAGTPSEVRLTA